MKTKINVIILAAGNSSRMNSKKHKSLHKIANLELIEHIFLSLSEPLILEAIARIILVCDRNFPFESTSFQAFHHHNLNININIEKVYQEEKLGTGHAVQIAQDYLDSKLYPAGINGEATLILYGDTPLIKSQTLYELIKILSSENYESRANHNDLSLLLFRLKNCKAPYGRIIFNNIKNNIANEKIKNDIENYRDNNLDNLETNNKEKEANANNILEYNMESTRGNIAINGHECQYSTVIECKEYRDLTTIERKTYNIANAGIIAIKTSVLRACLPKLKVHELYNNNYNINNNSSNKNEKAPRQEYYLTDIIKVAQEDYNKRVGFLIIEEKEAVGINTREDLAQAEYFYQERLRAKFLNNGVSLLDPNTVYFSYDTKIGQDVLIHPNVYIGGGVEIADNVEILSFSHLQNVKIDSGATIGPFARIQGEKASSRPNSNEKIKSSTSTISKIGKNCAIGNFVEIKNSTIAQNVKIKHLTYIGDSDVGKNTNIGAGTITCNFDGHNKNKTFIGNNCFIGANNTIVAPLTISDRASTAGGSTITEDVPEGALAIGRARQTNKENKE